MAGVARQAPHYAGRVTEREACLVDVYDTLLWVDFEQHRGELPALAGLSPETWIAGMRQRVAALGGRMQLESRTGRGATLRIEVPTTHSA